MSRLDILKDDYNTYSVFNKKKQLTGVIYYFAGWKQFVWKQDEDIIMSIDCLQEVCDFIKKLKEVKKE